MDGIKNRQADIGPELRRRRTAAKLSLQQLADRCHYSPGHISNVEHGTKPASEDFLRACDQALDTGGTLVALLSARGDRAKSRTWSSPSQLPPVPRLVGRSALVDELDRTLDAVMNTRSLGVIALDGAAGSGKTTLAVTWSHRIRQNFPDGVLFYDLRGYSANSAPADPTEVLETFLLDLGVPPADIPPTADRRATLLRTKLDRMRALLLLDNASDAQQVRPLLPGGSGCLVIITSRRRLSSLAVREGARCVTVPSFTSDEAVTLLREAIGTERVNSEPTAAYEIARLCAHLPLAVRVAAERISAHPHVTLDELARELSAIDKRLDVLSQEDEAVRAVFSWSYRALGDDAARLFRLLGLHSGDRFGPDIAAALCGIESRSAMPLLRQLSAVRLVDEVGQDRFRQHDLLKAYSVELVRTEESEDQRTAAVTRLVDWYLHTAYRANHALAPQRRDPELDRPADGVPSSPAGFTYEQALTWCEAELPNLVAATRLAHHSDLHKQAWQLPVGLWNYLFLRKPWTAWITSHTIALAAAEAGGDVFGRAWALNNLAHAHRERQEYDLANRELEEALTLRRQIGDETGQAWTLTGSGYLAAELGRRDEAVTLFSEAVELFRGVGDRHGEAIASASLGEAMRRSGRDAEALHHLGRALEIMRGTDDRYGEGFTLTKLGTTLHDLGRYQEALGQFDLALKTRRQVGDRWGEAETLVSRGHTLNALGDRQEAQASWRKALAILDELDDPRANEVRDYLNSASDDMPTPRSHEPDGPAVSTGSSDQV
ncbi:tetratricopeptide repeat protein [Actinosynnema sp. CA-299493]